MSPVDMVLHCPSCGLQHVDAPEQARHYDELPGGMAEAWNNPPHRSHLCAACGHVWRPADVCTNGVESIATKGRDDSPEPDHLCENEAQGYAVDALHQFCPELRFREDGRTLLTPAQVETVLRRMGWRAPCDDRLGVPKPSAIPPGWRFNTADFSTNARNAAVPGHVMLVLDEAGRRWWNRQPINDALGVPGPALYAAGRGLTFDAALRNACDVARAAEVAASEATCAHCDGREYVQCAEGRIWPCPQGCRTPPDEGSCQSCIGGMCVTGPRCVTLGRD